MYFLISFYTGKADVEAMVAKLELWEQNVFCKGIYWEENDKNAQTSYREGESTWYWVGESLGRQQIVNVHNIQENLLKLSDEALALCHLSFDVWMLDGRMRLSE